MNVRADRSTFSFSLSDLDFLSGPPHEVHSFWWTEFADAPKTDIQRKYYATIVSLEKIKERELRYDSILLRINSSRIHDQLTGKVDTQTKEIAELRSELKGLMTRMGVTLEETEIRSIEKTGND